MGIFGRRNAVEGECSTYEVEHFTRGAWVSKREEPSSLGPAAAIGDGTQVPCSAEEAEYRVRLSSRCPGDRDSWQYFRRVD